MSRVLLAVGHGRRDNGSYDPGASDGRGSTEQSAGDPIVQAAAAALRRSGVEVVHIPAGGPNFPGTTRRANAEGVDAVVEVHHDWIRAPRGAFGHWLPGASRSKALADAMLDEVAKAGFPLRPSWHKARTDLHILRRTRMPAVLWECDRIGSVRDPAKYGRALADGILRWLGATSPAPPKARSWFEMATREELEDVVRGVVEEALDERFSDRDYPGDIGRIRRSLRQVAYHIGLKAEHEVPDGPVEV